MGYSDALKSVGSATVGGLAGAGVYSAIGGVGLAVGGTAVGITAGPFIAIGAGLGAVGYGLFWLGKQVAGGGSGGAGGAALPSVPPGGPPPANPRATAGQSGSGFASRTRIR